jgi:hypothetical protein
MVLKHFSELSKICQPSSLLIHIPRFVETTLTDGLVNPFALCSLGPIGGIMMPPAESDSERSIVPFVRLC